MNNVISKSINFARNTINSFTPIQKGAALVTLVGVGSIFAFLAYRDYSARNGNIIEGQSAGKIQNISDLQQTLKRYNIDQKNWTKTVEDLHEELKDGECTLECRENELWRVVNVVFVKCFFTNENGQRLKLVEEKQVFTDGKVRHRGFDHVSEKKKMEELPIVAAVRGLDEELQMKVDANDVKMDRVEETKKASDSYEGFKSLYRLHRFNLEVSSEQYRTSYQEVQSKKTTYFTWVPENAQWNKEEKTWVVT